MLKPEEIAVTCEIEWRPATANSWDDAFPAARRSNLLQHFAYAQAVRATQQMGARHGYIHVNGRLEGICQLGEVGLMRNAIHFVALDRGPLFFDPSRNAEVSLAFFKELRRQFPRRWGRKLRIIPELGPEADLILKNCGFKRNPNTVPYETAWWSLDPDIATLRRALKSKWRYSLNRAERSPLEAVVDRQPSSFDAFLSGHESDKKMRGYAGASEPFLRQLLARMSARGEVMMFHARLEGAIVASILVLLHGSSATYQAGWTTPEGRHHSAHHLLLWTAALELKKVGILDFELGGFNDGSASGIKRFKLGTGAESVSLAGSYY